MRKYFITALVLTIPFLLNAQNTRYAGSVMEMGVGARALGMGSAYVALSNDVNGASWNPGGLALLPTFQAASMYANLFNTLETQSYVAAAMPVFGGASVAISWMRLSVDDIPHYEFTDTKDISAWERITLKAQPLTAEPADYFSSFDEVYTITFAKYTQMNLDLGWQYFEVPIDFGFGMNLKLLRQTIDQNSGSGMGLDAGMVMRIGLNDVFTDPLYGDLIFAINIQDATDTQITWDTDSKHKDRVAHNFKYGFSYVQPLPILDSRFTFAFDLDSRYTGSTHLGGEFLYHDLLALRAGMNTGFFTAGAGIYLWKFKLDYAYQSHDLGNSHRVSLLFGF